MSDQREKGLTAFLGATHMGTVVSACWASRWLGVFLLDQDEAAVVSLGRDGPASLEPGLSSLWESARPGLEVTTDFSVLGRCDIVFIAFDLQTDEQNKATFDRLNSLVDTALPYLLEDATLVLMSQVPLGFTRKLGARIREGRPGLGFNLVYVAETLIIGEAIARAMNPERFIVGLADDRQALPPGLAHRLSAFNCPIMTMSYESAELAKMAINFYLSASVTVTNTIADLCETYGGDIHQVAAALRLDRRIGQHAYLRPGLGIAGGNLERDLVSLKQLADMGRTDGALLEAVLAHNQRRRGWLFKALDKHVFPLRSHPKLCFWGLTYKKNSSSLKNSIALRVLPELAARADLVAYDPAVQSLPQAPWLRLLQDKYEALEEADSLLIMNDWPEFEQVDFERLRARMRRPVVIDCVNLLAQREAGVEGVEYVSVGRRS